MVVRAGIFDAQQLAVKFGNYARLQKKVQGLSVEELRNSEDYRQIGVIEQSLEGVTLSKEQFLEVASNIEYIVTEGDIMRSRPYKDLQRENEDLKEKLTEQRTKSLELLSKIENFLDPLSPMLDLVKHMGKLKRELDEELKKV